MKKNDSKETPGTNLHIFFGWKIEWKIEIIGINQLSESCSHSTIMDFEN